MYCFLELVPPPTFSLTPSSSTSSTGLRRTTAQRLFETSSPASSSVDSRDSDNSTVRKNIFGGRLSSADKFQWKSADSLMSGKVSEEQMQKQIISVHRLVTNRDRFALSQLSKNCPPDLDFSLPLRGVTALSLSVYLRAPDITKELLLIMDRMGQLSRGLNVTSVDSSAPSTTSGSNEQQKSDDSNFPHRETALVAACRTGQLDCVMLLLHYAHNGSTNKPGR